MAALARAGCSVIAIKLDSSLATRLAEVLTWAHNEMPFIEHFAHAAGVSDFALLEDISASQFHMVADVKVCHVGVGLLHARLHA